MFDIGFSELVVIGAVALVVIGPERLPTVARTLGALFGRAQRYVSDLKSEVQRELDLEEIKRIEATFYRTASEVEESVRQAGEQVQTAGPTLNEALAPPVAESATKA